VILMAEPERWQVSTDAAEVYESCFVPAIFGAWAGPVADAAEIRRGDKVLDVGCGTGVLAREALRRVGQEGQVIGLDLNEGMLAVAARREPNIAWRSGDAAALPFEDMSFDVVVSQFALMYVPDRVASLREMWRTLAPGGRLAVAAWAPIERARGYQILVDIAVRQCGREAADVLAAPFVLGAACHYKDGTFVFARVQELCAQRSPHTGARFNFWHPDLVTLHVWLWYPNPDGLYNGTNPYIRPFNRG
jgi:SAM-dependent methyltransferase